MITELSEPVKFEEVAHVDANLVVCTFEEFEVANVFANELQAVFIEELCDCLFCHFDSYHGVTLIDDPSTETTTLYTVYYINNARIICVCHNDVCIGTYHFMSSVLPQSGKRILREDRPLIMFFSYFLRKLKHDVANQFLPRCML